MLNRALWTILSLGLLGGLILAMRPWLPPAVTEAGGAPEPRAGIFDPRAQRVDLPDGYRPTLGRDVIRPIYAPRFVPADAAAWPDETLVLGVAIDGEAKAYPVNVLNSREMVIDRLRGIPLLVSW